jgi:hypothetical protein
MADVWREIEDVNNSIEREQAQADPKAHKLSKVMEKGANYDYYPAGKTKRGYTVSFCWTTKRNVAGYFLGWRQVSKPATKAEAKRGMVSTIKRDRWIARKSRKAAEVVAWTRSAKLLAVSGREPYGPDPRLKKRKVSEATRERFAAMLAARKPG